MNIFGAGYAAYYNLLYREKDYAGEAAYIDGLVRQHCPAAQSILNLGCGTGQHDVELIKLGYQEGVGVDRSKEMLALAEARLQGMDIAPPLSFCCGDVRTIRLNREFDAVLSLFHVVSYQQSDADLAAVFATAAGHLAQGGLFVFDCWYGPAVLHQLPSVRVKRLEDAAVSVTRIAEPVMHTAENSVDVRYQLFIKDKLTGQVEEIHETHRMRYLFLPEIRSLFQAAGMNMVFAQEWRTGKDPGCDTWGVCCGGIRV